MNRTALIKLASQHGYDLSIKSTDEKGNPTKVLVPLVMSRRKPLGENEVSAKPLPKYVKGKTDDLLRNAYPYSGYDRYVREGVITPLDSSKVDNSKFKQRPTSTTDIGLMNINKALASQLGGDPLAYSIANASAEYVRRNRYNALSPYDKMRYDIVAKFYGFNPHAITMTVPTNFNHILTKGLLPPQGVDSDQWNKNKVLRDEEGNPLLYNSTYGKPKFTTGSSMLHPTYFGGVFKSTPNKSDDGGYYYTYNPVDNIFSKSYLKGYIPITRENFPKWVTAEDETEGPRQLNSLISVNEKGDNALGHNSVQGKKIHHVPGISLENKGRTLTAPELYHNDYAIPDYSNDKNTYVSAGDNKSTADHEAIHAMNVDMPSDFALGLNMLDDAMVKSKLADPKNEKEVAAAKDYLTKATENLKKVDISKSNDARLNGFLSHPATYFETSGEGIRFLVTALRGFQNHLKEVLPPQMEARGELDGLSEKERNDKIGWKVTELSHDGDNFINYLRELGLLNGSEASWRVPVSNLGGISGREMNRSLSGIGKVTAPKEKLFEKVRPEDKEGKDLDSYDSVSEESIRQIIPFLLHNNTKDVNPDGSVLA